MSEQLMLKVKDEPAMAVLGFLVGEAVRVTVGLGVYCLGFGGWRLGFLS